MSLDAVENFYNYTFKEKTIQNQLLQAKDINDFIDIAVSLGKKNGYNFTISEMKSTMSGIVVESLKEIIFEDPWVSKVISVGWVPLGYTR